MMKPGDLVIIVGTWGDDERHPPETVTKIATIVGPWTPGWWEIMTPDGITYWPETQMQAVKHELCETTNR